MTEQERAEREAAEWSVIARDAERWADAAYYHGSMLAFGSFCQDAERARERARELREGPEGPGAHN